MRVVLTKTAAMLSVCLLLAGGQCVALCSTVSCFASSESAHHVDHSPSHCHQHGGKSSPEKPRPTCPDQEQSLTRSMDSHAGLVLPEIQAVPLASDANRLSLPALQRVNETSPPPLIPDLASTTVLRV